MSELKTPLDHAHAEMEAAAGDDGKRLRFYERLADTELYLMLTEEAEDDSLSPDLFEIAEGTFALVFDGEDRLAQFSGAPVPYAAISGRILAGMLDGQGIGLGLNLEVAPSSILIPAGAMSWLHDTLETQPDTVEEKIIHLHAPTQLPEVVLTGLASKLAGAGGLVRAAYLAAAEYSGGRRGHILAFVDAPEPVQAALAKAAGEALTFSGIDAAEMDVGFFDAADTIVASLASVGLQFDLPAPPEKVTHTPTAPGRDPEKPPILK